MLVDWNVTGTPKMTTDAEYDKVILRQALTNAWEELLKNNKQYDDEHQAFKYPQEVLDVINIQSEPYQINWAKIDPAIDEYDGEITEYITGFFILTFKVYFTLEVEDYEAVFGPGDPVKDLLDAHVPQHILIEVRNIPTLYYKVYEVNPVHCTIEHILKYCTESLLEEVWPNNSVFKHEFDYTLIGKFNGSPEEQLQKFILWQGFKQ